MKIIKATTSNIDDLVSMFDLYMQFYEKPSNPSKYKAFLNERLSNNEAVVFLAYDEENNPVGFVQNYFSFSSVSQGKIVVLNDLFVLSAYRSRGIGNLLIDKSIELGKEVSAVRVDLSTAKDNFNAQALYEKIGFVKGEKFFSYSFNI